MLVKKITFILLFILIIQAAALRPALAFKNATREEQAEAIKDKLASDNVEVRRDAIISLIRLGSLKYTHIFINMLRDEDSMVRAYAAEGLGLIGAKAAITDLRELIRQDPYPLVKAYCAKALGVLGSDAGAEILMAMVNQSHGEPARRVIAKALGTISRPDYLAALYKLAKKDPSSKVRINAVRSIGNIGTSKDIQLLKLVEKYDFTVDVQRVATSVIILMEERLSMDLPSNRRDLEKLKIQAELDIKDLEEQMSKKRRMISQINEKIQRLEAAY